MHADAVVLIASRQRRWARLRVRGLLRNAALAQWLESGSDGQLLASTRTGSVTVAISPQRDVRSWIGWVTRRLRSHALAADGRQAKAGAPTKQGAGMGAALHAVPMPRLAADLALGDEQLLKGLSTNQAGERLRRSGPNEIPDIQARSALEIFWSQFTSVPVALLAGSAGLAIAIGALADAVAIAAVLAANGTLGFLSERRAEETISSLRQLGPAHCTVLRDGMQQTVKAREVVVGDLLVLTPGEAVAADARVMQAHRLAINEAALTGESLPVSKQANIELAVDTPLGERRNMVFMGTVVSGGAGLALVVAIGERTALGHIRQLAEQAESPHTQLQQDLDRLGRQLALGAGAACIGLLALGTLRRRPFVPLLRTAVSLGVAAIPEGLPTVATSLLARSVRSLREKDIYARSLAAVEAVGTVDTVCFDKTGTLTQNRMTLSSVAIGPQLMRVADEHAVPALPEGWLQVAVLCNTLAPGAQGQDWQGSATELALVRFAAGQGADVQAMRQAHPVREVRHRSEHHPYMVTLHPQARDGLMVAVKGRPDEVLARCVDWFDGTRVVPLTQPARERLLALNESMATRGERVLALAWRRQPTPGYGETGGLCWLGMAGLADALRPGLVPMMARFRAAGVRLMMITGDQLPTAQAVARDAGFDDVRHMRDAALLPEDARRLRVQAQWDHASGFARTSPAMKLQIIRALEDSGHVVAMIGDGINDGPALKTADVGVAMGASGTDFAQSMSDLVLRADHPSALLDALSEGRTVSVNVRKSLRYLVATNLSELMAATLAMAAGLDDPFDPMAILWTNVVTDIWPAIALGLEPPEPHVLQRPPEYSARRVLEREEWVPLAIDAAIMALASLASYGWALARHGAGPQSRTQAFMTLTVSQLLYALSMRSDSPLLRGGLAPNPQLRHAIVASLAAQAATVMLPALRKLLHTTPLGLLDASVVLATSVIPLAARELRKTG